MDVAFLLSAFFEGPDVQAVHLDPISRHRMN